MKRPLLSCSRACGVWLCACALSLLAAHTACRAGETAPAASAAPTAPAKPAALPRLVDLGASKCVPCKMMAPMLASLKTEYQGQLEVVFIDVWENREAAQTYGIRSIPTQIFYAADGKELFRHAGFYSKADILAKWKELGVELKPPAPPPPKS